MTILEALDWGKNKIKETLGEKSAPGLHNPTLDAQILLSHSLQKSTPYLFAHFEDELSAAVAEKYQGFIERRGAHEPVAYIVGQKEFFGRPFTVNRFVLIPRPETELIIDEVKNIVTPETDIIDVGTGSGAIAVTLAAETQLPIVATDLNPEALAVAKVNAEQNKVSHLISFLSGDLLTPYLEKNIKTPNFKQTIIVANLPYVKIALWPMLDPDVRLYEPKSAIVGGVDGFEYYDPLLSQIKTYRSSFAHELFLILEIDPTQEISAPKLVREYFPSAEMEIIKDLNQKSRVLVTKIK